MRFSSFLAVAALAVAPAFSSPSPEGTVDVSKTSVDFDSSKEALDRGELTLHITRTDELFADHDDNTRDLLLSRFSHIKLGIQLDSHAGCLRVNDQELPLTGQPNGEASLAYVKAEALRMPIHHPTCMITPGAMEKLEAEMSPGIIGMEVRLEAEIDDLSSTPVASPDGQDSSSVDVSVRRIGVFIKITEIEGLEEHQLVHSSFVYAPILQLLVRSHEQDGSTVTEISTIAVNGHAPVETLPPPPKIFGFPGQAQPPAPFESSPRPHHHHHHHHHHGHRRYRGFFARLAKMLGLYGGRYNHHQMAQGCKPPVSPPRLGLAGAGRRPSSSDNTMATANNEPMHKMLHHPVPLPQPPHCYGAAADAVQRRPPSAALVYTGSVLAALWSTIFCKVLIGILMIGMVFHTVRRAVLLVRRKRQQRQQDVFIHGDEYQYDHVVIFDEQEDKKDAQVIVDMSHVIPEHDRPNGNTNNNTNPPPYQVDQPQVTTENRP